MAWPAEHDMHALIVRYGATGSSRDAIDLTADEDIYIGMQTTRGDFRVDDYPPTSSANTPPVLATTPDWLLDTEQIGESQPEYRIGFVARLHEMADSFKFTQTGGKFWHFGKIYGGMNSRVSTALDPSVDDIEAHHVNKRLRSYTNRLETVGSHISNGVRVFFAIYNTSRGRHGSHWTLGAFVLQGLMNTDRARMHAYYFDPLANSPKTEIMEVHTRYADLIWLLWADADLTPRSNRTDKYNRNAMQAQQENPGIDCGVWCCWAMLQFVAGAAQNVSDFDEYLRTAHQMLRTTIRANIEKNTPRLRAENVLPRNIESRVFRELLWRPPQTEVHFYLFLSEPDDDVLRSTVRQLQKSLGNGRIGKVNDTVVEMFRADHENLSASHIHVSAIVTTTEELASENVRKTKESMVNASNMPVELITPGRVGSGYVLHPKWIVIGLSQRRTALSNKKTRSSY